MLLRSRLGRCHGGRAQPAAARRPRNGRWRRPCGLGGGQQRPALPGWAGGAGECGAAGGGRLGRADLGAAGPAPGLPRLGARAGRAPASPRPVGPFRAPGIKCGAGEKRSLPQTRERPRSRRLFGLPAGAAERLPGRRAGGAGRVPPDGGRPRHVGRSRGRVLLPRLVVVPLRLGDGTFHVTL